MIARISIVLATVTMLSMACQPSESPLPPKSQSREAAETPPAPEPRNIKKKQELTAAKEQGDPASWKRAVLFRYRVRAESAIRARTEYVLSAVIAHLATGTREEDLEDENGLPIPPSQTELALLRELVRIRMESNSSIIIETTDVSALGNLEDNWVTTHVDPRYKSISEVFGVRIIMDPKEMRHFQTKTLSETTTALSQRLKAMNVSPFAVQARGDLFIDVAVGNQSMEDAQDIMTLASTAGRIHFHAVEGGCQVFSNRRKDLDEFKQANPELASTLSMARFNGTTQVQSTNLTRLRAFLDYVDARGRLPHDRVIAIAAVKEPTEKGQINAYFHTLCLEPGTGMGGEWIETASVNFDDNNQAMINVVFSRSGQELFGDLTQRLIGRQLAIEVDGFIVSAPTVMERINGGRAAITLGAEGTAEESRAMAENLARTLRLGALPASLLTMRIWELDDSKSIEKALAPRLHRADELDEMKEQIAQLEADVKASWPDAEVYPGYEGPGLLFVLFKDSAAVGERTVALGQMLESNGLAEKFWSSSWKIFTWEGRLANHLAEARQEVTPDKADKIEDLYKKAVFPGFAGIRDRAFIILPARAQKGLTQIPIVDDTEPETEGEGVEGTEATADTVSDTTAENQPTPEEAESTTAEDVTTAPQESPEGDVQAPPIDYPAP